MTYGFTCIYCGHEDDHDASLYYEYMVESDDVIWICEKCGKQNATYVTCEHSFGSIGCSEELVSNGKWGYIDKSGNEVIPHIYIEARDFR